MKYYVERMASGYVGNCLIWWRKGGHGYGCDLNEAEVFDGDSDKFKDLMKSDKYRAWPKEHVDESTSVHVDMQRLNFDTAVTQEDME